MAVNELRPKQVCLPHQAPEPEVANSGPGAMTPRPIDDHATAV
ncbi:MAG TPA: hypothetical protein ACQGQF_06950 [Xylella fastidiosa subsp. pauca]